MIAKIIYVFWLDGIEKAPPLVKYNISRWTQLNPEYQIITLDRKDAELVMKEFYFGVDDIAVQALSDILRIYKLKRTGGIWIDATVLPVIPLSNWLDKYASEGFFVFEQTAQDRLIGSWFIAASNDCLIIDKWWIEIKRFWSNHRIYIGDSSDGRKLIPSDPVATASPENDSNKYYYFWLHYLFSYLYASNLEVKNKWDSIPKLSTAPVHELQRTCRVSNDYEVLKQSIQNTVVQKLNWRENYPLSLFKEILPMKKKFEKIIVHIGPHKTASTSIQEFLFANREKLRLLSDLDYLDALDLIEKSRAYVNRTQQHRLLLQSMRELGESAISKRLDKSNFSHVIISCENLVNASLDGIIKTLFDCLYHYTDNIEIIFGIREPFNRMLSLCGELLSYNKQLDQVLPRHYSYSDISDRFKFDYPIVFKSFFADENAIDNFLDALNINKEKYNLSSAYSRERLSAEAIVLIRSLPSILKNDLERDQFSSIPGEKFVPELEIQNSLMNQVVKDQAWLNEFLGYYPYTKEIITRKPSSLNWGYDSIHQIAKLLLKGAKIGESVNSEPMVSVIITYYNQVNIVHKSLESVIHQTLKRIEIICVDDCSSDGTFDKLLSYQKKDARIKIIKLDKNSSSHMARKEGVKIAAGEYVMFLDGDDFYELNACEVAYSVAKEHNVDILNFGTFIINMTPKRIPDIDARRPIGELITGGNVFEVKHKNNNSIDNRVWNKIYRRELIKKSFDHTTDDYLPLGQDRYVNFIAFYFAQSYYGIKDKLYNYCFGMGITGNVNSSYSEFARIITNDKVYENIVQFVKQHGELNSFKEILDIIRVAMVNNRYNKLQQLSDIDKEKSIRLLLELYYNSAIR